MKVIITATTGYISEKSVPMRQNEKLTERNKDRALGCLVGGAVGDALGYAIEFEQWPYIHNTYGDKGIKRYELASNGKALISDDTQMTLFTAEVPFRNTLQMIWNS